MPQLKVISQPDYSNYEIQDKRFPLPGAVVSSCCPKCSVECIKDFEHGYISCPKSGVEDVQYFYCELCDYVWEVGFRFIIEARIEPIPETGT